MFDGIDIILQLDGSLYVRAGGLNGLTIDPVAANGVVIKEKKR